MTKIKEDHVSFEIAKLLKEKGFDEICRAAYTGGGKFITHHNYYSQGGGDECVAPTHQMTIKWLREVHNINIEIRCYKNIVEAFIMTIEDLPKCLVRGISSNKYEETVEAALKYCLKNLI